VIVCNCSSGCIEAAAEIGGERIQPTDSYVASGIKNAHFSVSVSGYCTFGLN
jgi:hypothetical protein